MESRVKDKFNLWQWASWTRVGFGDWSHMVGLFSKEAHVGHRNDTGMTEVVAVEVMQSNQGMEKCCVCQNGDDTLLRKRGKICTQLCWVN